jgi:hypothetical protein
MGKELEVFDNTFRLTMLRINYYKKNFSKINELFNSLIYSYADYNLRILIRVLAIDNNKEKDRRLIKIEKDRLRDIVKRHKTCVLEHLYMMLVVMESSAIDPRNSINMMERFTETLQIIQNEIAGGYEFITPELRQHENRYHKSIQASC